MKNIFFTGDAHKNISYEKQYRTKSNAHGYITLEDSQNKKH